MASRFSGTSKYGHKVSWNYHILAISAIQFSKQPVLNIQFAHQFVKSHLKNTPSWVILIRDGVMMEYFL